LLVFRDNETGYFMAGIPGACKKMRIPLLTAAATIAVATALHCGPVSGDPFYRPAYRSVRVQVRSSYYTRPLYAAPVYGRSIYGGPAYGPRYQVRPASGILGLVGRALRGPSAGVSVRVAAPVVQSVYSPPVIYPPVNNAPTIYPPVATWPAPADDPAMGNGAGQSFANQPRPAAPATSNPFTAVPGAFTGSADPFSTDAEQGLPATGNRPTQPARQPSPFDPVVTTARHEPTLAAPVQTPPASNAQAQQRAVSLVTQGDKLFAAQRFHEAGQRYKSAIAAAPELGAPYFRRAFALIATNRYDLAAPAAHQGAMVDPAFVKGQFRVDTLYNGSRLAKDSHLDALARTALGDSQNADNWFLVGMFLHFDGQSKRAQTFLQKAVELERRDTRYLAPFLSAPEPQPQPPASVLDSRATGNGI